MINLNAKELDKLFQGYGFTPRSPDDSIRVYLRTDGYFQNAEIVPLHEKAAVEDVRRDFERSGFSCKVSRFRSVDEAEQLLFRGFFQQDSIAKRLSREYEEFCAKTSRSLGSTYEYIHVPYLRNGEEPTNGKPVTVAIRECFDEGGPVLVFLEAAAGFGKTCTAFDLLHHLLESSPPRNPILAELRRNRQARIFKYVLYDEMNRNYRGCGLTPEMVEREIKSGRIPLIIDGFDELLHLDRDGGGEFAEVEPMLRTLSGLLESEAKVLVTTRRTAVLGSAFDDWLADFAESGAKAYRFTLQLPRIEDWIGGSRQRALEDGGFPLATLANPVLLSFIRHLDDEAFSSLRGEQSGLVQTYFESLLVREKARQELPLSPEQQMGILETIAGCLLDRRSSWMPREELRGIVLRDHHRLLRDALRAAPDIAARTPEELADKLTDHALLDAKSASNGGICFVNDFVAGTLFGAVMLRRDSEEWFDESEMDKAVTAFHFRGEPDRTALWTRLREAAGAVDESWQVRFDLLLRGRVERPLRDCMIQDVTFCGQAFGANTCLQDVVFMHCGFEKVTFYAKQMTNVGFTKCEFRSCAVEGAFGAGGVWFSVDSTEFDGNLIATVEQAQATAQDGAVETGPDYERTVLEQFWPPGRPHARVTLKMRTLYQGIATRERELVSRAIDSLRKDGLITFADKLVRLEYSRMAEVRAKLGK